MRKTNFDQYLEEQLKDEAFAERFEAAGEAWDVALQIAALREKAGLSQKDLARRLKTSQQNISRLESPSYEGHSLTMLRRVATALDVRVRVTFEPAPPTVGRRALSRNSRRTRKALRADREIERPQ
jgi:transcriptional regulator with XRE-family HTH domain